MKAIAKLKDDARKYEQREEWERAIQAYLQVLKLGEEGDGSELDLPLYNRVGDLYVRLGRPNDAVTYYEQAADRYAEAGLFNNAIALCNKALRYDAGRLQLLRKLGAFSASQGFFTDARRWYLEYAEKAIKRGQMEDAFNALSDYANVNDDADARELLARYLRDHGRADRAVNEYKRAYSLRIAAGQQAEADRVRKELHNIDPAADLSDAPQAPRQTPTTHDQRDQLPGFVDLETMQPPAAVTEPEPPAARAVQEPESFEIERSALSGADAVVDETEFESIDLEQGLGIEPGDVAGLDLGLEQPLGATTEEPDELPTFEDDESVDDRVMTLPTFEDLDQDETTELPLLGEEDEEVPEEPAPLPGFDGVKVEADLPMIETIDFGMQPLEVGEVERDETGHAGEPLTGETSEPEPEIDFDALLARAQSEAVVDLPSFGESDVADLGTFAPERAFEFITPDFEAEIETPEPAVEAEPTFEIEEPVEAEYTAPPELEYAAPPEPEYTAPPEPEYAAPPEPAYAAPPEPEPAVEPQDITFDDLEMEPEPSFAEPEPEPAAPEPVAEFEPAPFPDRPQPTYQAEPAASAHEPVNPAPTAAPARLRPEYVDLAALLRDEEHEAEESTRFVVAEKPPTGDEEQDFADMLEQFRSKVAASIPTEDVGSHYDLGIAYKEMGLIDEAIGEFQTALRGGQDKLKVYEELGSCFVLKGNYSIAITVLNRAQQTPHADEHEMLGVYYNLGRAHEELGQRAEAKAAYEKIVAIDIGFGDTRQRLARL